VGYRSIIPVFGRLRQKDLEFKASLGYPGRLSLKAKKQKQ
jgi:hypothetical protein